MVISSCCVHKCTLNSYIFHVNMASLDYLQFLLSSQTWITIFGLNGKINKKFFTQILNLHQNTYSLIGGNAN